jgi:hypothetical protein
MTAKKKKAAGRNPVPLKDVVQRLLDTPPAQSAKKKTRK